MSQHVTNAERWAALGVTLGPKAAKKLGLPVPPTAAPRLPTHDEVLAARARILYETERGFKPRASDLRIAEGKAAK